MVPELNQYALNTKDWWTEWNIGVTAGNSDQLFNYPVKSRDFKMDWPDETGIDIDLTVAPVLKERSFNYECFILIENTSANYRNFLNRYTAFIQEWQNVGLQDMYSKILDQHYYVVFDGSTKFERFTPLIGTNQIYATFTISFLEPKPVFMAPKLGKMVTFNGKFVTFNGKILII